MPITDIKGTLLNISAGTKIINEADLSRKLFIIKEGKVRVFKTYMNQKITLAVLGAGEVFGELSFFDAEPRSASVEALTDVQAVAVDGEKVQKEIAQLPDWVFPVFRTVFHRFRELDRRIIVLQSMNEYQKKTFKIDHVGKTIYIELLRFNKAFQMISDRLKIDEKEVKSETVLKELDDILGNRYLGLRVYWKLIKEHDLIDHEIEEVKGIVQINDKLFSDWNDYLMSEVESERFLILSHSAIALLRRLVGLTYDVTEQNNTQMKQVDLKELKLKSLPLAEDALKEILQLKICDGTKIEEELIALNLQPKNIFRLYSFQSMIKCFDHTTVSTD